MGLFEAAELSRKKHEEEIITESPRIFHQIQVYKLHFAIGETSLSNWTKVMATLMDVSQHKGDWETIADRRTICDSTIKRKGPLIAKRLASVNTIGYLSRAYHRHGILHLGRIVKEQQFITTPVLKSLISETAPLNVAPTEKSLKYFFSATASSRDSLKWSATLCNTDGQ